MEHPEANQSHQTNKVKVMSVSLASMVVLGAIGITKIIFPSLFIMKVIFGDQPIMESLSLEVGLSMKVGEGLINVLFTLFNCRNLIGILLVDMYSMLQELEGVQPLENENGLDTFSETVERT